MLAVKKTQKNTLSARHKGPFVYKKNGYGHTDRYVRCTDRQLHPYLNESSPDPDLKAGQFSACPQCWAASSEMVGTVGKKCAECRMEEAILETERVQRETGTQLMAETPDWIALRAIYGFRDSFRSGKGQVIRIGKVVGYND